MNERLLAIVAVVLGVDREQVTPESSAENLPGWDSLAMLNLAMTLEGEFGIELSPEDIAGLTSVARTCAILRRLGIE